MPAQPEPITPSLLRGWSLPAAAESKYQRGSVLVLGGARKTPGAALLAGLASLRVGAGRLTLAVADSVAVPVAVQLPEAGVVGLAENLAGIVLGRGIEVLREEIPAADVVVVGPGLADPQETRALLGTLLPLLTEDTRLLLDAFTLGVLPDLVGEFTHFRGQLLLTPNLNEAARLLDRDRIEPERALAAAEAIATRYRATVSCQGLVAAADGSTWELSTGTGGLATSGSGDVLAGAIGGVWARGATSEQAACWGTHLHAAAGDRLAARVGPLGFLARELLDEFPALLKELA